MGSPHLVTLSIVPPLARDAPGGAPGAPYRDAMVCQLGMSRREGEGDDQLAGVGAS